VLHVPLCGLHATIEPHRWQYLLALLHGEFVLVDYGPVVETEENLNMMRLIERAYGVKNWPHSFIIGDYKNYTFTWDCYEGGINPKKTS
jgi:hypothetical protein